MKARKFFAFVAGAAMLFGGVACTPDEGEGDTSEAEITVSPATITTKLEGGEYQLTVTSNGSWVVNSDQSDVVIAPSTGANNGVVTVTIPSVETARNFSIKFVASKEAMLAGIPYTDTDEAVVSVYQNAAGNDKVETNVKAVRDLLVAMPNIPNGNQSVTPIAVTDEIATMTLTGVLVAEPDGNLSNNKSIVVQDDSDVAGSGLTVYCTGNVSDDLVIGDIVSISLAGATTQYYNGLLQVSNIAPNAIVVNGSTTVTPIDVTLDNALEYESQYVKLSDVCPASGVAGNVWNSGTSAVSVNFTTIYGVLFVIRVSGYASFKSETIPEKSGYICGVVSVYNGTFQLMPQYASDIQLTNEITEPEATSVTIAEITKAGLYKVENAWVVATYTRGCLLTDASSAYMLAYNPTTTPAVGTVVSIEGTVSAYNDVLQFGAGSTINATSETKTVTHPTAAVLDGAAIDAYYEAPIVKYAELAGILTVSGNFYNVTVDGATVVGSISNPNTEMAAQLNALNGVAIKATGYMIGKSTSNNVKYANMMVVSVEADTSVSAIYANDITGVSADGVVDANANITVVGVESVNATFDGVVVTAASVSGNVLTYTVSKNETEIAREGCIKLNAEGIEEVTIAVKQNKPSSGSIEGDYTKIDDVANLTAGTYLMAGYCESYYNSSNQTTTTFSPYSWHFWTGGQTTSSGKMYLYTVNYSYVDGALTLNPNLSDQDAAKGTAVEIELVAVDGKTNTYCIKYNGKYLNCTGKHTIALVDNAVEWTFEDHSKGGIKLTDNTASGGVILGTAGASYNMLRCYAAPANSLVYGVAFFKKN